jgi:PLP dependent protein
MTVDATAIAARLGEVRERIVRAAASAERDAKTVRLILASKTQPAEAVAAAYAAGAREFGENYVQEAVAKRAELADLADLRWHLIGTLQRNKARVAIRTFELIHTLDRASLASALYRLRAAAPMPVLIEVNLAGEATKSGVAPENAEALIDEVRNQVDIQGLMTVPPAGGVKSRRWFAALRELRERLASATGLRLAELSMGMTEDYEAAIAEGATMVRIGRAVFAERSR